MPSDPTTQKPEPRDGFLIVSTTIDLDDGGKAPAWIEMGEDEFMDEFGLEAAAMEIAKRDVLLRQPKSNGGAEHEAELTGEDAYEAVRADAIKMLMEVASAIGNGAPVGAVVLAACPVNGAPVIGTCWTMAPDQYEKALGMLAKLQAKMAMDDRRV